MVFVVCVGVWGGTASGDARRDDEKHLVGYCYEHGLIAVSAPGLPMTANDVSLYYHIDESALHRPSAALMIHARKDAFALIRARKRRLEEKLSQSLPK